MEKELFLAPALDLLLVMFVGCGGGAATGKFSVGGRGTTVPSTISHLCSSQHLTSWQFLSLALVYPCCLQTQHTNFLVLLCVSL